MTSKKNKITKNIEIHWLIYLLSTISMTLFRQERKWENYLLFFFIWTTLAYFNFSARTIQRLLDLRLPLRPCVSIRLSEIRVISGKCTGKAENRNTNISVHFRIAHPYRQGFPFEKPKMVRKFSRNRVTKMSETPV